MSKSKRNQYQRGGGSDFSQLFYAQTVQGGPAALSQHTLDNIDKSPMFNPLEADTVFPTGTTGVLPNGLYFAHGGSAEASDSSVFNDKNGNCTVRITRDGEYKFVLEGVCKGATSGTYVAASPPDFRSSYAGSGLPYPNEEIAFTDTPNKGKLTLGEGGSFKLTVVFPNSYYINNGSTMVMPQVCFDFNNIEGLVEVPLSDKPLIQNRSLSSLPGKTNRSIGR